MTPRPPSTPPVVSPVDPDSPNGQRIAREFGQLIADVEDRLAQEAAEARIRSTA